MPHDPETVSIFHITDVANLPSIFQSGGLSSDARSALVAHEVIGYEHIKRRRLEEYRVPCCGDRFVGEFVPFYFCPRSPMLYTINRGTTGRPAGCQASIVHLVSTVAKGIALGRPWAISDGNAGAAVTDFDSDLSALDALDWTAIRAADWARQTHQKMAEFLVADFFEWNAFHEIGCHNETAVRQIGTMLARYGHRPKVTVRPNWYY